MVLEYFRPAKILWEILVTGFPTLQSAAKQPRNGLRKSIGRQMPAGSADASEAWLRASFSPFRNKPCPKTNRRRLRQGRGGSAEMFCVYWKGVTQR